VEVNNKPYPVFIRGKQFLGWLRDHHKEAGKAVPQHTYGGVGGRGYKAPTLSRPRH
jgi:hypothetical protein